MILRILMENIESGSVIKKFGTGEATRTWLYIDDIVDCFMKALFFGLEDTTNSDIDLLNLPSLSLYEEFNTGSTEGTVTLNQVIETAEKVIGKKANIQEIKEVPKGDARFIGVLDYSKAKSVLGWEPRYNLEQGMTALKKYYEDIKSDEKKILLKD
jgi:nucleoside-diphosphate-sugar epimerase